MLIKAARPGPRPHLAQSHPSERPGQNLQCGPIGHHLLGFTGPRWRESPAGVFLKGDPHLHGSPINRNIRA